MMYMGKMVAVAVWGRNEKVLCALVVGIVLMFGLCWNMPVTE